MRIMNAVNQLDQYRRPEVKSAVQQGANIWLGSAAGLFCWRDDQLEAIAEWQGKRIDALAATDTGLVLLASDSDTKTVVTTDDAGRRQQTLPSLTQDTPKALAWASGRFFAGGKRGIYRLDEGVWQHCYGQGHTEIIGLHAEPDRLLAYCKKQGDHALPALLISTDQGQQWTKVLETGYHDGIIATWGNEFVTRWRGLWQNGSHIRYEKRPFSAAAQTDHASAWVKGSHLVCRFKQGTEVELVDPRFAEAEHLFLLSDGKALLAGIAGAYLIDLSFGQITDLFSTYTIAPQSAKVKRLWSLDEGRVLATATYGTFYSDNAGAKWQPADAEWSSLDAEGLACTADGAWYMATQRGLFSSWDNGATWRHVKLSTQPHFTELTALAVIDDRLALGSKAGLFISDSDQPKALTWVKAVGNTTIHGLLASEQSLWVGTVDGRLMEIDPLSKQGYVKALFHSPCLPLCLSSNGLWVLCGGKLFEIHDTGMQSIPLPADATGLKDAMLCEEGLVVWNHQQGWICDPHTSAPNWCVMNAWLPGTKSLTRDASKLISDRYVIGVLQ
jgi:hypothetical protein